MKRMVPWAAALLMLWSGLPCRAAETDRERIEKLEEKVRQLEAMVQSMAQAQKQSRVEDSLQSALGGMGTSANAAARPETERESISPQDNGRTGLKTSRRDLPQELLPNLGKIGATANFVTATGFGSDVFLRNRFYGGSLHLPMLNLPGGKLSYEVAIGVLSYDRPSTGERRRILELIPFGFTYAPTIWDRFRVRPFLAAGLGNYVVLTSSPAAGAGLHVGTRFGGGVEWRMLRDVSLAFDIHRNWANNGIHYTTVGPRAAWHF